jgi:hypothetical protein
VAEAKIKLRRLWDFGNLRGGFLVEIVGCPLGMGSLEESMQSPHHRKQRMARKRKEACVLKTCDPSMR